MTRVYFESYNTSYLSTYSYRTQLSLMVFMLCTMGGPSQTKHATNLCILIVLCVAGDAVFPGEIHWGTRCPMFAGDAYSPVKFIGAPDAQCLQAMPCSLVEVTGAPDAQCLQGMPCSLVKFTGVHMLNVCRGCYIPR